MGWETQGPKRKKKKRKGKGPKDPKKKEKREEGPKKLHVHQSLVTPHLLGCNQKQSSVSLNLKAFLVALSGLVTPEELTFSPSVFWGPKGPIPSAVIVFSPGGFGRCESPTPLPRFVHLILAPLIKLNVRTMVDGCCRA